MLSALYRFSMSDMRATSVPANPVATPLKSLHFFSDERNFVPVRSVGSEILYNVGALKNQGVTFIHSLSYLLLITSMALSRLPNLNSEPSSRGSDASRFL